MKKTIVIESLDHMEKLARHIASYVKPGFLIGLEGDLGAGKTTFTQFLGRAIGISERINSPTFTILKVYEHRLPLYHIDAYRLTDEFSDYDIEEYFESDGVCVVEWYKNIVSVMPKERLNIHIKWEDIEKRIVSLEGSGYYETLIKTFSD